MGMLQLPMAKPRTARGFWCHQCQCHELSSTVENDTVMGNSLPCHSLIYSTASKLAHRCLLPMLHMFYQIPWDTFHYLAGQWPRCLLPMLHMFYQIPWDTFHYLAGQWPPCPKKLQNCFCQNFVKCLSTLIMFGTQIAQRIGSCEVRSSSTSTN